MLMCVAVAFPASAQFDGKEGNDFGLWMTVGVDKKINKKWSVGVEFEYRLKDNIEEGKGWGASNRWSIAVGADYKPISWLKLDAGYKFIRDHSLPEWNEEDQEETEAYWGSKHRVYASATGSYKVQNVKFSLRERWQYTYRPEYTVDERWSYLNNAYDGKSHTYAGKGKNVLRSRLQVEFDKKGWDVTPYANVELFNAWSLQKTRYTVGLDWKLSKQHAVGAFYRYQNVRSDDDDNEPNRHMIGVGYTFKF